MRYYRIIKYYLYYLLTNNISYFYECEHLYYTKHFK